MIGFVPMNKKKKSLSNEFSNGIAVLDKKGLKTNLLEKKKNSIKQK